MNPRTSYRLGVLIVAGVVSASTALVVVHQASKSPEPPRRVAHDLGDHPFLLGSFQLTERSGKVVTEADLASEVWVSAFIFTRCPSACPRISSVMKGLQGPLNSAGVKLVSITVDPGYDTPEVLKRYAAGLDADLNGWWFLTGQPGEVVDLVFNRFKLGVEKNKAAETDPTAEAILHSPMLVLVDRGNKAIGYFDSNNKEDVQELVTKARRKASWARKLPAVNATLNGSCAVLLVIGWGLILSRRIKAHAACMISAVVVSALFLACYLLYHYEVGSVAFPGTGTPKVVYLSILLSHTILATFGVVPLVSMTLVYAIRKRFDRHAPIARVTFPIWLYVSITGVVIYWMLYQMPIASTTT